MITNLLASIVVTLVTNVSDRVPMTADLVPCPDATNPRYSCAVLHFGPSHPVPNPDKKWVKTTVKQVRSLQFEFEKKQITVAIGETFLSEVEVEFEIVPAQNWKPVSTNETYIIHLK